MLNQPTVDQDRIVKPHQKFLIPNYFIWYWLRELGPALAWLVLAIQQACWRVGGKLRELPQALLAREIGLSRQTVISLLQNPLSRWHVEVVPATTNITSQANRYRALALLLTPQHQAGLYGYFQQLHPASAGEVAKAIDHLLALPPPQALTLIETYEGSNMGLDQPLSIAEIVTAATSLKLNKALTEMCSALQSHLTNLGFTACRQYFRLRWVPQLGPALAWLMIIIRSRCFYNPETGELRNQYQWSKGELAACLGQTTRNLSNLLAHQDVGLFLDILAQTRRTMTLQIEMMTEPIVPQPDEIPDLHLVAVPNAKKDDSFSVAEPLRPELIVSKRKNLDSPPPEPEKSRPAPSTNRKNPDTIKYFNQPQIPSEKTIPIVVDQQIRQILAEAGLQGVGLSRLCRHPDLDPQTVRAVVLYARIHQLGPGYIYQHLRDQEPIDDLFLALAHLDDTLIEDFQRAAAALQRGMLLSEFEAIAADAEIWPLFVRFVAAVYDLDPAALAALQRRDHRRPVEVAEPTDPELAALWDDVLDHLSYQMIRTAFDAWLRSTWLIELRDNHFLVAVKNGAAYQWLEHRLAPLIRRAIKQVVGCEAVLEFQIVLPGQPLTLPSAVPLPLAG